MSLLKRTRLRLKEKLFPVNIPCLTQSKYIIRTKNNFFLLLQNNNIYFLSVNPLLYKDCIGFFGKNCAAISRAGAEKSQQSNIGEDTATARTAVRTFRFIARHKKRHKKIFIPPKFPFKSETADLRGNFCSNSRHALYVRFSEDSNRGSTFQRGTPHFPNSFSRRSL